MSDAEYLLNLATWFEEQDIEFDATRLLDIADNYVQILDNNAALDEQVQQLADELARHEETWQV